VRGLAIIDLETVPRGAVFGAPVSVPVSVAMPDPPGSYKKPESREKWRETHGEAARVTAWGKWALDPLRAQIAGAALLPLGDPDAEIVRIPYVPGVSMIDAIGAALVEHGIDGLASWGSFDGTILRGQLSTEPHRSYGRCLSAIRGDQIDARLSRVLEVSSHTGRPWLKRCVDLSVWSVRRLHGMRAGWGLDSTAEAHGIGRKTGVASSGVLEAWALGDAGGIVDRAAQDVALTLAIADREGILSPLAEWWSKC